MGYPTLNLGCHGCQYARPVAMSEREGMVWVENKCKHIEILAWVANILTVFGPKAIDNEFGVTIILDRLCKKFRKKRKEREYRRQGNGNLFR